jgi:predicted nucleic acid-binding protein
MKQEVVTNAGPLMLFAKLNILHLLKELCGKINFPRSVWEECVTAGIQLGFSDAYTLRSFLSQNHWHPESSILIPAHLLSANLDLGEKEAIALALSRNALLLMDEEEGRLVARQNGLSIHGSLWVLIKSYRRGLISEEQLRFYFRQVSERTDIWISPSLCVRLLNQELGQ